MKEKRGQISLEYVIILGVVLVVLIPLFHYSLSRSKEDIRIQQASDAVTAMTKKADEVLALGLGSKDFIWVTMPSGINNIKINDKTLILNLSIFGQFSEFVGTSKANLTITTDLLNKLIREGTHKVTVEAYKNITSNTVVILLGGYCGDSICSSIENAATCSTDCKDYCGDGICNYPGNSTYKEGCDANGVGTYPYCSDCIGSQVDCAAGNKTCQQNQNNPSQGICISTALCGDGICYGEPYIENCQSCAEDCHLAAGEQCCYDAVLDIYYRATTCGIPPSVTSCPDWCVYIGDLYGGDYDTGVCAQNSLKCNDFGIGGNYTRVDQYDIDKDGGVIGKCGTQDHPPGDGECDGDEYCFAGAQANTCCCVWV